MAQYQWQDGFTTDNVDNGAYEKWTPNTGAAAYTVNGELDLFAGNQLSWIDARVPITGLITSEVIGLWNIPASVGNALGADATVGLYDKPWPNAKNWLECGQVSGAFALRAYLNGTAVIDEQEPLAAMANQTMRFDITLKSDGTISAIAETFGSGVGEVTFSSALTASQLASLLGAGVEPGCMLNNAAGGVDMVMTSWQWSTLLVDPPTPTPSGGGGGSGSSAPPGTVATASGQAGAIRSGRPRVGVIGP